MAIFLTGATGFLGGQLVKNLLHETSNHLYILARSTNRAQMLQRSIPDQFHYRLTFLYGDIEKPYLGLSEEQLSELHNEITIFYHVAALVKFDEELRDELFAVNLQGTKHTLEVATAIQAKKYYYVSTAYTIGKRSHGEEKLYPINQDVHNPYEESKVQSEHLVFSYANQLDVSIFRPSIIVGHSKTGEADSNFTLYGFMRALEVFKRRALRTKQNENKIYRLIGNKKSTSNFVPVDYVANILSLAVHRAEANTIYNITNPHPITNYKILQLIKEALQFHQLEIIEETTNRHILPKDEQQLNELINVFNVYLARDFQFDDENTRRLIENSSVEHLQLSEETLRMIIHAYNQLSKLETSYS